MSVATLLHRTIHRRADARPLAAARILIGINAVLASLETWRLLSRMLLPAMVRIPFFAWIPVLPSSALLFFMAIWLLAALLFAIGWKTRVAGVLLALVTGYTLGMDQQTYSNHLYLLFVVILLLTIADSGAAWSLDARGQVERSQVAAWPILLVKVQATAVYFFSGVAKVTRPYLAGEVLTQSLKQEGLLVVPRSWHVPEVMSVLAVLSIAAELFIAFGLWSRRVRPFAMLVGVGFHGFILVAVDSSRLSLLIFALSMFAAYLLFAADGSGDARLDFMDVKSQQHPIRLDESEKRWQEVSARRKRLIRR